jgi:succinate dehydrogenase/fumarate reductase flavoprotein subunit
MRVRSQEKLSCEVLVIGGGGAGLRSAIAARLHNADVILASKTRIGPSSNTYISKAIIAATGWGTPDDDENVHLADTVEGGRFLNDQAMVAKVAQRTHAEISFLKECGVAFGLHAGKLRVLKTPGHRYSRHVHGANWCGRDLAIPLKRRAKHVGVRFAEHVYVTRLIEKENQICGAAGITPDGRFFAIHAKAVVLATGGFAQIYLNTNNVPGITGDGQALAYDAGIPLKDMEFVQFYPTATGRRGSRLMLYEQLLAQPGVALRNERGENILKRHGIADPTQVTRDRLAQLVTNEISQGASPDQQVFMDVEALSEEMARPLSSILPSRWWKGQKVFRVMPTTHFCMGGIVTDQNGETPLKGLFAVGEAAAGVHGANRLGGNALAEIFTMGSVVGEAAAARSGNLAAASVSDKAFDAERSRLEGAYSNQGSSVRQLIKNLKQLMWAKVGVIREEKGLLEALEHLRQPCPRVAVSSPTDLIRLLEFRNMRCVAQMVCRSALERTESRGSHFRSDYPSENNREWLKNVVLRKSDSAIKLKSKPVMLDLVRMDTL